MENQNINLTENSYIFQTALRLATKEVNKAANLLLEHEDKWNESLNLKLYDAFSTDIDFECNGARVVFDSDAQNEWFYRYCEDTYDQFIEWCKEENIDFNKMCDNIGRTSSFYLGKLHADNLLDTFYEASDVYTQNDLIAYTLDEKGNLIIDYSSEEDLEDALASLLNIAEYIYKEVEESLEDIIKVYNYIQDTKNNQVEYFKDYVKEVWIDNV